MRCDASSSWLRARHAPPIAATTVPSSRSPKRHSFFFFFFVKRKLAASCCAADGTTPTGSSSSSLVSSRSYGRPWYNTLRRRQLDHGPEVSRLWVDADQTLASSQERFMVASYNILGDRNAFKHKDLYANVPYVYMKWGRRKRVICEELIGWNPDIICLQEVDKYSDLLGILAKAGYVGSFKRRTGDSVDGCATFWKSDKFRLLEGESIEFKGLGLRDNVAQISVFEADM